MPFTLSHAAAAIPFRRSRLILSALVIGTFAPDFEYFFLLAPVGKFGHTLRGALLFDLPMALAIFWLFHLVIERPAIALLPDSLRLRIAPPTRSFRFTDPATHLLAALSAATGIATHLLWDSFTHQDTWPWRHIALLRMQFHVPILHNIHVNKLLQHGSTVFGGIIVLLWIAAWRNNTPLRRDQAIAALPPARRTLLLSALIAAAIAVSLGRAALHSYIPTGRHDLVVFGGKALVTSISVFFALLVVYGLLARDRSTA